MERLNVRFLVQQAVAFLMLGYLVLIGGSESGILFYGFRRLSLIILALIVIAWLVSWITRGFPFPRTRLDLAWLLFVLAQLLATALSTDPRRGVTWLTLVTLCWLAFYVAVDLLRRYRLEDLLVSTLLLLGVLIGALGVVQLLNWYRSWWEIGGWEHILPPATVRIQAIVPHPNFLAAYLNVLLPFGVAVWIKTKNLLARAALAVWVAVMLVLLLATSSRGSWIGAAAAMATLSLLFALDRWAWVAAQWRRLRRRPAYMGLLGLLLAGALVAGVLLVVRQAQHPGHGPLFSSRQGIWSPVWMTFARSPLWGSGPATYATQAMQLYSIPPYPLYTHAHSLPLNTLLESGLLGTLALGVFVLVAVRSTLLQWRSCVVGGRSWLIAAIAALVATLVHSLFDTPQAIPGFSLLIVLMLDLVEGSSPPGPRRVWVDRASRVVLGLAWPALIGTLAVGLMRYAEYTHGVALANRAQYEAAAPLLDQAAAGDPALATNWFQAGYVHAMIGLQENDGAHLRQAVEDYRAGLALEPSFATNWANLGVLLWRTGDEHGSREALQQAVERASREAAFALTLGAFEEEMGNPTCAAELYRQGLEVGPAWADGFFFRATPLRAMTRRRWLTTLSVLPEPLQDCWEALQTGELEEANRCFSAARALNDPNSYYGLGLTALAAGDLAQAEWNLRVATWISDLDSSRAARLELALGDVLGQRGDLAGAIRWYENALARLNRPGPMQSGAGGVTTAYTWFVFNREAIVDRLLPGAVWVTVTNDAAERMLQLGDWYEQLGQTEDAACMYRDLLEAVPDLTEAEERLRVLESREGAD